jgi:polycystin 1L2
VGFMGGIVVFPVNAIIVQIFRTASRRTPIGAGDAADKERRTDLHKAMSAVKKTSCMPYWFIYIAWILVFLSVTASAFFTILYSLEWGNEKSVMWLTSFIVSFLQSILLLQPMKVRFL